MLTNLLVLYYFVALIYLMILILSGYTRVVIDAMILITCPLISIFILYAMHRSGKNPGQLPEWLLRREKYVDSSLQAPNIEKDINIVPFHDALLLNNPKVKRQMLMDLLKSQRLDFVSSLEHALKNDDPETSHYAAAAVQQAKDEIMINLKKFELMLENEQEDESALVSYIQVLKDYLEIEFLDHGAREKYKNVYLSVLKQLISLSVTPSKQYYTDAIETALELEHCVDAATLSKQFLRQYPEDEDAYFASLAVSYKVKDRYNFDETIRYLRSSNTKLSPKRLNQLRFWLQGDQYGQEI